MTGAPKPRDPMFLIIAGAITAIFLPFALAFPPSLLEKLVAVVVPTAAAKIHSVRRSEPTS